MAKKKYLKLSMDHDIAGRSSEWHDWIYKLVLEAAGESSRSAAVEGSFQVTVERKQSWNDAGELSKSTAEQRKIQEDTSIINLHPPDIHTPEMPPAGPPGLACGKSCKQRPQPRHARDREYGPPTGFNNVQPKNTKPPPGLPPRSHGTPITSPHASLQNPPPGLLPHDSDTPITSQAEVTAPSTPTGLGIQNYFDTPITSQQDVLPNTPGLIIKKHNSTPTSHRQGNPSTPPGMTLRIHSNTPTPVRLIGLPGANFGPRVAVVTLWKQQNMDHDEEDDELQPPLTPTNMGWDDDEDSPLPEQYQRNF